ncbi:hypothetical protein ACWDSJ_26465 [Nocardia sp. NPDC003482]
MIAPVVPPQAPLQQLIHGTMPTPAVVATRDDDVVYGLSTVGQGGRVVDRRMFARLGWHPGERVRIDRTDGDVLVVSRDPDGPVVVHEGFVRVPYRVRRRAGLFLGDRVLLLGRISRGRLAIHPPTAMQELFAPSLRLLER